MGELTARAGQVQHRLRVVGRVQGVGFRWFACDVAQQLVVAGWTQNLPDGSVLIEAAATAAAMDAFVVALRTGPPASHVADVLIEPRATLDALPTPFTIRR